jgi:hypothetical protein
MPEGGDKHRFREATRISTRRFLTQGVISVPQRTNELASTLLGGPASFARIQIVFLLGSGTRKKCPVIFAPAQIPGFPFGQALALTVPSVSRG